MQFFKTAIFFSLVAVGLAAAAPEGDSEMLQKRGFGCPDDGPCNTHVSSRLLPLLETILTRWINSARISAATEATAPASSSGKCLPSMSYSERGD